MRHTTTIVTIHLLVLYIHALCYNFRGGKVVGWFVRSASLDQKKFCDPIALESICYRTRANRLINEGKPIDKREQYNCRAEKNLDGNCYTRRTVLVTRLKYTI